MEIIYFGYIMNEERMSERKNGRKKECVNERMVGRKNA